MFTPVTEVVDEDALAGLREEAGRLGPTAVLDLAVADLRALAGGGGNTA